MSCDRFLASAFFREVNHRFVPLDCLSFKRKRSLEVDRTTFCTEWKMESAFKTCSPIKFGVRLYAQGLSSRKEYKQKPKAWFTFVIRIGDFLLLMCVNVMNKLICGRNVRLLLVKIYRIHLITSARRSHRWFLRQMWTRLKCLLFLKTSHCK